jgi:dTDP-glucose pyrophosphorylase
MPLIFLKSIWCLKRRLPIKLAVAPNAIKIKEKPRTKKNEFIVIGFIKLWLFFFSPEIAVIDKPVK